MKNLEVRSSRIKGEGLVATRPLPKGEVILAIDDSVIVRPDDPVLGKLIGGDPDPCDYLPDGTIILMQEPERFINHSCDPNVCVYSVDDERFVLAMRDISAGEELVFDYAIGLVGGDWLDCRCGSPTCRGRHRSDFFLLPGAKQLEYLPYLGLPFVQVHRQRILKLLRGGPERAAAARPTYGRTDDIVGLRHGIVPPRGGSYNPSMLRRVPLVFAPQPEGGFTVTSPVLPELVTEGDALEQAYANVADAFAAVIELYAEQRRPFPPRDAIVKIA